MKRIHENTGVRDTITPFNSLIEILVSILKGVVTEEVLSPQGIEPNNTNLIILINKNKLIKLSNNSRTKLLIFGGNYE